MHRRTKTGILAATVLAFGLTGCAKWRNQIAADGGILGTYEAPYIVIKQSGGVITDVYKLPSTIIQSEAGSDGWLFRDGNGHPIHIGGDMKSIRLENERDPLWDCYKEYHMEYETQSYQQKHAADLKGCEQFR